MHKNFDYPAHVVTPYFGTMHVGHGVKLAVFNESGGFNPLRGWLLAAFPFPPALPKVINSKLLRSFKQAFQVGCFCLLSGSCVVDLTERVTILIQ